MEDQRPTNNSHNTGALSHLQFKRKRQKRSPFPVRHAPTPSPSESHGKAPIEQAPSKEHSTNKPTEESTVECNAIFFPFHSHFVVLSQWLFFVLSPDSVDLAWWVYVTVHILYPSSVQLMSQHSLFLSDVLLFHHFFLMFAFISSFINSRIVNLLALLSHPCLGLVYS